MKRFLSGKRTHNSSGREGGDGELVVALVVLVQKIYASIATDSYSNPQYITITESVSQAQDTH